MDFQSFLQLLGKTRVNKAFGSQTCGFIKLRVTESRPIIRCCDVIKNQVFVSLFVLRFRRFLNLPSHPASQAHHSSIAAARSSGELAGRKFSQKLVASRKHISAKNLVCKSSLDSSSSKSSIEFSAICRRFSAKVLRFIFS